MKNLWNKEWKGELKEHNPEEKGVYTISDLIKSRLEEKTFEVSTNGDWMLTEVKEKQDE